MQSHNNEIKKSKSSHTRISDIINTSPQGNYQDIHQLAHQNNDILTVRNTITWSKPPSRLATSAAKELNNGFEGFLALISSALVVEREDKRRIGGLRHAALYLMDPSSVYQYTSQTNQRDQHLFDQMMMTCRTASETGNKCTKQRTRPVAC